MVSGIVVTGLNGKGPMVSLNLAGHQLCAQLNTPVKVLLMNAGAI